MKVSLVTGGAGFLGSHLCDRLIKDGHKVICLDNFVTGRNTNIEHLLNNENFSFIKHDITKPIEIDEKIDYIFHLASPASPIDYQKIPIKTIMANTFGTYNALNLTLKDKAKFILSSTSEVYGDPKEHPQREDYWGNVNSVGPRSNYDESKRVAEALTVAFLREHDIDVRIIRIFNTYGPRMRANDGRVIPNFVSQILSKQPVTVYGDGNQTRSFCFVDDLIEGICRVMFSDGTKGEVINLGNPNEMTINELSEMLMNIMESNVGITYKDLPIDDPTTSISA